MTKEKMIDKLQNAINGMDNGELVQLWNEYTDKANYPDDHIYSMDEFNEIMYGRDPLDIALTIECGDFNSSDDWFWFNGYGNICTAYRIGDDYENSPLDLDAVIDYIIEHGDSLYNDDIADILAEADEECDEEDELEEPDETETAETVAI